MKWVRVGGADSTAWRLEKRELKCPVCGYEMDAVMANEPDTLPEPGDPNYCIECTSLLQFTPNGLGVMTPERWGQYPPDHQEMLRATGANMAKRPASRRKNDTRSRYQTLIIPRGDHYRVAVLFLNGLLVLSDPVTSRHAAKRMLAGCQQFPVVLRMGPDPNSGLWYAWPRVSAFGKDHEIASVLWGPQPTREKLSEHVLKVEVPKLLEELGAKQLSPAMEFSEQGKN